eukprot:scaffold39571_cov70-Phaeocystis_antarctica.AAC.12
MRKIKGRVDVKGRVAMRSLVATRGPVGAIGPLRRRVDLGQDGGQLLGTGKQRIHFCLLRPLEAHGVRLISHWWRTLRDVLWPLRRRQHVHASLLRPVGACSLRVVPLGARGVRPIPRCSRPVRDVLRRRKH